MKSTRPLPFLLLILSLFVALAGSALAGSATWNLSPTNGDWNTALNWTPNSVPDGPSDTATFGVSNITNVSLSTAREVNGIVFNSGASGFVVNSTPTNSLTISGAGITNNSGINQSFRVSADAAGHSDGVELTNGAAVGSSVTFTVDGGTSNGMFGGGLHFGDTSSAGTATLIANGGTSGLGGVITFDGDSNGGTSRIEVFDNGTFDISAHNSPGVTIGSLEGNGSVLLGSNSLTTGSGHLKTAFSGVISGSGSLILNDSSTLTLQNANTYTGGTTIFLGGLIANNNTGSATGPGPVQVNKDTLGGQGIIAGPVTIGAATGVNAKAYLEPSVATKGSILTIQSLLTFTKQGNFTNRVNTSNRTADAVVANGIIIQRGARYNLGVVANKQLPIGLVLVVMSNTSGSPISGSFLNFPEGGKITSGRNTYQASYVGGDGNDMTLTVVTP